MLCIFWPYIPLWTGGSNSQARDGSQGLENWPSALGMSGHTARETSEGTPLGGWENRAATTKALDIFHAKPLAMNNLTGLPKPTLSSHSSLLPTSQFPRSWALQYPMRVYYGAPWRSHCCSSVSETWACHAVGHCASLLYQGQESTFLGMLLK